LYSQGSELTAQRSTFYLDFNAYYQFDSITVLDRTAENLFPYIAAVGITLGMTLFVVGSALRERWSNR
jgi:hypothetical protein